MAPALPKWIQTTLPTSFRRPSASYDTVEDGIHERKSGHRHPQYAPVVSVKMLYWVVVILVLTIWVLAVALLSERGWIGSERGWGDKHWSMNIIPKGAPIPYTFHPTYNYSDFDFKAVNGMYNRYYIDDEIVGVPIPDAKKYDLPPGYPSVADPRIETYEPSFIHQFHCINLFRDNFWDLRRQLHLVPPSFTPKHFQEPQQERLDHVEHCYDYMRQTIQCWADTTMEGPASHPDGQRTNTDGMFMKHKCYDMDAVWQTYRSRLVPSRFVRPGDPLAKPIPGAKYVGEMRVS